MKRWLLRLGGVGVLAGMFAVGVFAIALQPSDAPFLYYYSAERGAFIILRADSSDGRVLARYSLPDEHTMILGPGWSASGEWFAWTSGAPGGMVFPGENVYVVNRNSDEPFPLFKSAGGVQSLSWSPNADLLLVGYFIPSDDVVSDRVAVYDVENKEFVIEVNGADIALGTQFYSAEWTPDGQHIALFDGRGIRLIPLDGGELRIIQSHGVTDDCNGFGVLPHWFGNGRMAYLHPERNALVIEDLDTQEQLIIELSQGFVDAVDWSPDNNYALVYVQPTQDVSKHELWLLSVADEATELLSNDVRFINNCNGPFDKTAWNADNDAVFTTADGQLRLVSAASTTVLDATPPPLNGEVYMNSPIRWTPDGDVMFSWYASELYGSQIYTYDPESGQTTLIVPDDPSRVIIADYFAPLWGNYLAYQGGILNLDSGVRSDIHFDTHRFTGSFGIEELYWHPTEDWLFLAGWSIENLYPINVMRMDGSIQRELALCPLRSASCFGWMPEVQN